ncbi:MAG: hypothetical protein C0605_07770 [Hyphomicrobiales bacterium]|nr:MAG: hypothetical protein C0605_07770 [Hyphomicrobiales bacterium]
MHKTTVHAVFEQRWGGPQRRMVALALACQAKFDRAVAVDMGKLARDCELSQQEAWRIAFSLHRRGVLEIGNHARTGPWLIVRRPAHWPIEADGKEARG